jgi:hypothetical protein
MSNRLPETDLANWAFLSHAQKWEALVNFERPKMIRGTYEPFRSIFGDAVNEQSALFSAIEQPATPWVHIEEKVRARCRSKPKSLEMNLAIARATHEFAQQNQIVALPVDVTMLALGIGHLYAFGLPILMRYQDRVVAAFLDLRRSSNLTPQGRDWVFSAMHERFRSAYPDLANIGLQIWRYRNNDKREIVVIDCDEPRHSFDELKSSARDTYEIFAAVLRQGTEDSRRRSGGAGPLI